MTTPQLQTIQTWLGTGSINLFGMPFAGKDTQGSRLEELLGGKLLGGGEILRNSVIPDRVRSIMESGDLIPIEDYLEIVLPYLSKEEFRTQPLILSSVGRWKGEEDGVMKATESSGHPMCAVMLLTISEDVASQRHALASSDPDRGDRADDADSVVANRFAEFREKTMPVIEHYRELGLLIEIDGTRSEDEVTELILDALYQKALAS